MLTFTKNKQTQKDNHPKTKGKWAFVAVGVGLVVLHRLIYNFGDWHFLLILLNPFALVFGTYMGSRFLFGSCLGYFDLLCAPNLVLALLLSPLAYYILWKILSSLRSIWAKLALALFFFIQVLSVFLMLHLIASA